MFFSRFSVRLNFSLQVFSVSNFSRFLPKRIQFLFICRRWLESKENSFSGIITHVTIIIIFFLSKISFRTYGTIGDFFKSLKIESSFNLYLLNRKRQGKIIIILKRRYYRNRTKACLIARRNRRWGDLRKKTPNLAFGSLGEKKTLAQIR